MLAAPPVAAGGYDRRMTESPTAQPRRSRPRAPPERQHESNATSSMAVGLVLVLVGVALFAGQLAGIGIEDIGWPIFVIAAGVGHPPDRPAGGQ